MDIVTFAMKYRMLFDAHNDVQIARRAPTTPGIALSRNANPLTVARSRFDTDFEGLGDTQQPLTVAIGALILNLSGSMTTRAGHVELHPTAGLSDLSAPFAFRTGLPGANRSRSLANWTHVLAGNTQAQHSAANRLPESNVDLVFKIGSRFWPLGFDPSPAAGEDAGEDIAESAT